MSTQPVPVVGRPFARFAQQVGGLTADAALAGLRDGTLGGADLVPGQGLTEADRAALGAVRPRLADAGLYKTDPRNVLIADLVQTEWHHWRADLVLHPANAVLADRDNGTAHVPGMVELEACLQMAMAATERYLLPSQGDYAFTTKDLAIRFSSFLFPLPAAVELRADRADWPHPDVLAADLTAVIVQSGQTVAEMRFQARVFERAHFTSIETARARDAARATRTDLLEQR
jgi:hypothetical protein